MKFLFLALFITMAACNGYQRPSYFQPYSAYDKHYASMPYDQGSNDLIKNLDDYSQSQHHMYNKVNFGEQYSTHYDTDDDAKVYPYMQQYGKVQRRHPY